MARRRVLLCLSMPTPCCARYNGSIMPRLHIHSGPPIRFVFRQNPNYERIYDIGEQNWYYIAGRPQLEFLTEDPVLTRDGLMGLDHTSNPAQPFQFPPSTITMDDKTVLKN